MANDLTKIRDLIDPEILTDMISAKVEKGITALPYAEVDTTLAGGEGSTITVPQFVWDGEAVEVPEGEDIPIRKLGSKSAKYTVKKIGIGFDITDESLLEGHGDPLGAGVQGISNSILAKLDEDTVTEMYKASTIKAVDTFGYDAIVDGVDAFNEEIDSEKGMLVPPHLISVLRKDPDFIDKTKYGNDVMMNGEIGMVGGVRIKPSRRVEGVGGNYFVPLVKFGLDGNDAMPALKYFIKRDTNIETDRKSRRRTTEITGDQLYVVALTNDEKVVLVKVGGAELKAKKLYEEVYNYPDTAVALETTDVKGKVTGSIASTTGTFAVAFTGKAKKLSATDKQALGFDESATHYITFALEVPGAGLGDAPTVTYGGAEVPANQLRKIGQAWYVIAVAGLKLSGDTVVLASGQTTMPAIVCGGITSTFTPTFNVTLEA
ncbi:MAG: N4-gp56 family major capsid protein [Oscillospiraceae bacterium]|nr:N4-gp56 family major capsid protein [Candidatus Ruminococcus equi]